MAELRKKLTDTQKTQLLETQTALAQARAVAQRAEAEAQRVVQLIFDAHQIPPEMLADFDQDMGELVCRTAEQ